MKLNIKAKLLIGFVLLLALSSLVQAFSFSIAGDYIYAQKKNLQLVRAESEEEKVEEFISHLHEINYELAKTYKLSSKTGTQSAQIELVKVINSYIIKNKQIESISIIPQDMKELIKINQINGISNNTQLPLESQSKALANAISGSTSFSEVYTSNSNQANFIDIYTPVIVGNKIPLVIKMQVNLDLLNHMLVSDKVGENGIAYIVDNHGKLVAHPEEKYSIERPDLSSRKIISGILKNQIPSSLEEKYKNENNTIVTAKAVLIPGLNWAVIYEEPLTEVLSFTDFMRSLFFITLLGSLLVLIIIALILSDNLTRPIRLLQNFTQLLLQGKHQNIKIATGDEIETLTDSFNTMAVELLQRENNLKKQEQEKEIILQSLSDGVIAVDNENKIKLFNKEAERITGLNYNSAINKHIDDAIKFYDIEKQITFDQIKTRLKEIMLKVNDKTQYFIESSGNKIKISLIATPVITEENIQNGWVITIHDMRKEQELEEMKIDFVSMAAHELRTPLTAIRGYIALLQDQTALNADPSNKVLFNRLMLSTEKLSDLIDNLLNISRIERETFRIVILPVDISEVVNNIVNGFRPEAYALSQKIEIDHSIKSLPKVMADPFRISQVLSHLITNAINYSNEGNNIIIKGNIKDNFVEISVTDNGRGIPPESLPNLFTKFFRIKKPNDDIKGTGLGLYICKSIIDMHKGKIWAESELNKGSTFTFSIPIASQA